MKDGSHPHYRPVVVRDRAAGDAVLTRSTAAGTATIAWEDGAESPVVDVDISPASHPFSTGTRVIVDTAGRVDRCNRRQGRSSPAGVRVEGCAGAATHRTAPLVPTVRLAWHRVLWASRACSSSQEGVGPGSVLASPVRG